ncbi:unnamed protein product [Hermetia illucens]|uniref:MSP domain-containing protein n=1 Tax=Hermetia illucens TaxID=343691 RepID=A0A7R8UCE8_HERIL|nr:vesicle-associated membrane protein-associated protein B/C-like [Hermetia illucens]CAD7077389.1 unnamed protein product [Hermetia illucens]
MEKKAQLLIIEPQTELKFRGPFTKPVTTHMRLTNPTEHTILFKIKTTAPRKYCVRPNFGSLSPDDSTEIAITLQAFVFDPNEKNKHKFMVQSLVVPDGVTNFDKLWKEVQLEELMDSKLRCVFEAPVELPSGEATGSPEDAIKDATNNGGGDDKPSNIPDDYQRAIEEVKQLRVEESALRHENLQLKEQLLKLRMNMEAAQEQQQTIGSNLQNLYTPPTLRQQQIPISYIALGVVMVFLGLLCGKYLL